MVSLNSVLNVLEKWERWKLLNQTPERVDELEACIKSLEGRLTALGDGKLLCQECGDGPVTIETPSEPYGDGGEIQRIYRKCPKCGFIDKKNGAVLTEPKYMAISAGPGVFGKITDI